MPRKRGPNTYLGFESPPTGGQPPCVREMVKKVYGHCRVQHPDEDPELKAMCARIAWSVGKKRCR